MTTYNIKIKAITGQHPILRTQCQSLFQDAVKKNQDDLTFDFSGVLFVSRAFAHEFNLQKQKSFSRINIKNMSPSLKPMFTLTQKTLFKSPHEISKKLNIISL